MVEDLACVRYVDRYRREEGRWLFAARVVNRSRKRTEVV